MSRGSRFSAEASKGATKDMASLVRDAILRRLVSTLRVHLISFNDFNASV